MATSRSREVRSATHHAAIRSGYADVGDHRLYWERHESSDADPVVLLHHGLGSIRSWRRQVKALSDVGFDLVLFDRWGYGRSDPRPGFEPGFLQHDAQEALRLLDRLGLQRAHLVGHSDGGTIALLIAAEHPERVISLVVVAAHIYYEPKMLTGLHLIEESISRPPLALALQKEHGERGQDLARAWIEHWLESDPQELSMQDQLADISAPTLVIQGEQDEHATPRHAIDIAEGVQHGHLWLIPGARHMPMHEVPDLFNEHLLAFLAEHASS
jgi:pimeloyl-ACP methyl ester carboxylesterase